MNTFSRKTPLRILYLEDDLRDQELLAAALTADGLACEFLYAATKEEFEAGLERAALDLILADVTLPSYDGMSALALARKLQPQLPFLFVSGTIGEERVIETLKAGATDYVLKHHLERIGPAVRRALRETESRQAQKQAEEELCQTHEKMRHLLAHSPAVIYTLKIDGETVVLTVVSDNIERLLGVSAAEAARHEWWLENLHPDDRDRARTVVSTGLKEDGYSTEYRIRHRNGTYVWIEDNNRVVRDASGRPSEAVGVWTDVTERKRLESEERFRDVSEAAGEFIWETDSSGRFTFASERVEAVLEYRPEDILGRSLFEVAEPSEADAVQAFWNEHAQAKTGFHELEFTVPTKSGKAVRVSWTAVPIIGTAGELLGFRGASLDITERKELEAKFLRVQRLESIGSLASGIAHDLNNILTPILMGSSFLRSELAGTDHEQLAATMESSAERAVGVVKQLLSIGRGQGGPKAALKIGHLIREMGKIARGTFPRSIQVEEECSPDLWPVQADSTQIHQILLNLCVNARDAMPRGGRLTLSAQNVILDEHYVSMHQEAAAGPFVRLQVTDTGTGIPEAVREQIFHPFFSTKDAGIGTGLGLTTVLGIVKDHHGFITFTSLCGEGTSFEIHLPASPDAQSLREREQAENRPAKGRGELVLVVDDEPVIREAIQRTLERHGYTVVQAADGIDALVQHLSHAQDVRVVVTDLFMPAMDGMTLCRALRRLSPNIPIIVSTGAVVGQGVREIMRGLDELNIKRLLHKPHSADALLMAVHEALRGAEAPVPE